MITKLKNKIRKAQAAYYARKVVYSFDKNWFKDKRVAIVGGADSVLNKKNGAYIDDFDVVVRINRGVELIKKQQEYVGARTDVLFHSFYDNPKEIGWSPITGDLWNEYQVKHVVYSKNYRAVRQGIYDLLLFVRKTRGNNQFADLPKDLHTANMQAVAPYRPTTGFITLNTVFNCQPKELFVTGITFFQTAHNANYRTEEIEEFEKGFRTSLTSHNPKREYEYFKELYQKNRDIIKPDEILLKLLS